NAIKYLPACHRQHSKYRHRHHQLKQGESMIGFHGSPPLGFNRLKSKLPTSCSALLNITLISVTALRVCPSIMGATAIFTCFNAGVMASVAVIVTCQSRPWALMVCVLLAVSHVS